MAVSQLCISAQVIFNTRITSEAQPEIRKTKEYCARVGARWKDRLFQALTTGHLHFVLAFRPFNENVQQAMLESTSLIAKREVIRARAEIERLGFTFHISPIRHIPKIPKRIKMSKAPSDERKQNV